MSDTPPGHVDPAGQAGQVVALRFDEPAAAEDLARWCDGEVERVRAGAPGDSGDSGDGPPVEHVVIWVPGREGPRPARLGDWIVCHPDGSFRPVTPEDFAARYEPADPGPL
jgi:hypothetical protein